MLTVTATVVAARLTSAALYCISGSGACEVVQHDLSEAPESCASPLWACIWWHGHWDIACAHSAAPEESMAHAESGARPATKTLNANPKMSTLRINPKFSTYVPACASMMFAGSVAERCDPYHVATNYASTARLCLLSQHRRVAIAKSIKHIIVFDNSG